MADWRMLSFAPKDGTEIEVQMLVTARAFWCKDQERFVLSRPLARDYVDDPSLWRVCSSTRTEK